MSNETVDPSTLTIPQLISLLSAKGTILPGSRQKKEYYLALARAWIADHPDEVFAPVSEGPVASQLSKAQSTPTSASVKYPIIVHGTGQDAFTPPSAGNSAASSKGKPRGAGKGDANSHTPGDGAQGLNPSSSSSSTAAASDANFNQLPSFLSPGKRMLNFPVSSPLTQYVATKASYVNSPLSSMPPLLHDSLLASGGRQTFKDSPARHEDDLFDDGDVFDQLNNEDHEWTSVAPKSKGKKQGKLLAQNGRTSIMPTRRQLYFSVISFIVLALSIILAKWYTQFYSVADYCHVSENVRRVYGFLPSCRTCPAHATCTGQSVTAVEDDYYLSPSRWTLLFPVTTLLPFPFLEPRVVLDKQKLERQSRQQRELKVMADQLLTVLRRWTGCVECGEISVDDTYPWVMQQQSKSFLDKGVRSDKEGLQRDGGSKVVGVPVGVAKEELFSLLKSTYGQGREENFDANWEALIAMISGVRPRISSALLSVSTFLDPVHDRHRVLSTSLPAVRSLTCRIRRQIWRITRQYWLEFLVFGLLGIAGITLYYRRLQDVQDAVIVARLVDDILSMVHRETQLNAMDPSRHPVPGIAVVQVKDALLPVTVCHSPHAQVFADGIQFVDVSLVAAEEEEEEEVVEGRENSEGRMAGSLTSADEETSNKKKNSKGNRSAARRDHDHRIWYIGSGEARSRIWEKARAVLSKSSLLRCTSGEMRGESCMIWQSLVGSSSSSAALLASRGRRIAGSSSSSNGPEVVQLSRAL